MMNKTKMKINFNSILVFCAVFSVRTANGAETSFDYPELSVVPRATAVIAREANLEREHNGLAHLQWLVPATTTLISGAILAGAGTKSDQDPSNTRGKYGPWIGIGVGAVWIGATLGLFNRFDFYSSAETETKSLTGSTIRDQLTRERRAEEAIVRAASLAKKLKWISVITNLGAGVFMIDAAQNNSFASAFAIGSSVISLTPLFFNDHWETVEELHHEYKKRIYGPVASVSVLSDSSGKTFYPGMTLALQF